MSAKLGVALASAIFLAGCGGSGRSDSTVAGDLKGVLNQNGVKYQDVASCTHQVGNQYVCQVTMFDFTTLSANVVDDGKSIYEQGIPANACSALTDASC